MIRLKEIRFQYCNEYYTCMSGFLWSWLRKEKATFQGQGSFFTECSENRRWKFREKSRNLFSGCRYLSIGIISVKTSSVHTQVGILDFKWQGWAKDYLGLKFSISGFFWVGKFWLVFFLLACEQQMYFLSPLLSPFAGYFFMGSLI